MDLSRLLDTILTDAKSLGQGGMDKAAQKLGVGADNQSRNQTVKSLGTGAVGGLVLGLLLGSKGGRKIGGKALKVGSMAALAGVAYSAYRGWKANQQPAVGAPMQPAALPAPTTTSATPALLLRAMISAANADGHVDEIERARILTELDKLGLGAEAVALFNAELAKPASATELAMAISGEQQAVEVYAISALVIGTVDAAEQRYLANLQAALRLPDTVVSEISAALA
jgi:uncharacterized membrane protein YebE (DUF533 family)